MNLLSETSADISGIQQARPAVQTSDNELLFSALPSVFQVLSQITGIKATTMWQHSWQTEASQSRRQKILASKTKPILANKSQQSRDKDTKWYFPSHPAVVHSATCVFRVTLLQDLISPQHYNIKAMISQYEREKNWVSIQHIEDTRGRFLTTLFHSCFPPFAKWNASQIHSTVK